MQHSKLVRVASVLLACALFLTTMALGIGPAFAANDGPGTVYVETNAAAGNAIAVFHRADDGTLTAAGTAATQGLGTGAGLGSQGALALSADGHWLYAVDAGSNDISVLRADRDGLTFASRVASGGTMPISVAVHEDLVYVLNAGSSTITGFRAGWNGTLAPLVGSTRPLSGTNVGPAQIAFAPRGDALVVTEKATSQIDTYIVGWNGLATGPAVHPSVGSTPFGFGFAGDDHVIVSDAGSAAVSSYHLQRNGGLAVVTGAAPDHQSAPCWIAVTGNSHYAYTTNAGSGTITGFGVDHEGQLTILNPNGITGNIGPGTHPTDMGFTGNSHYLYALLTGATPGIAGFQVASDGSLTGLPTISGNGVTAASAGLIAR